MRGRGRKYDDSNDMSNLWVPNYYNITVVTDGFAAGGYAIGGNASPKMAFGR